ncbi:putative capsular polysaccharide synthesis family protein [Methyloceanibacter sp.]|uniref:putative capsular polysaccharide synthesis family protein n=1 Tax=Methyloceanibacter sp. TaxID=1965321 RepID=UPI002C392F4C|nr:putative capsular polysaccharide synthesis family protein [Methyloceanibacter sp.]HML91666.1 putative capsular polysaccharide synthesis family protein [Methyloceanibacter sp.]
MAEPLPIFVWTMGKVGTSTISAALRGADIPALHLHYIRPKQSAAAGTPASADDVTKAPRRKGVRALLAAGVSSAQQTGLGQLLWQRRAEARTPPAQEDISHTASSKRALELISSDAQPVKVITMVREPIARNISAFFQNLKTFQQQHDSPVEHLIQAFEEIYPHDVPLEWFDSELKQATGFDVYAETFNRDARVGHYTHGRFEFLLMRSDTDLERQQAEVSDFVQKQIPLTIQNAAKDKAYSETYAAFKKQLVLSEQYVQRAYTSKFARHFWTDAELDELTRHHLRK